MYARFDNQFIYFGDRVQGFGITTRYNFNRIGQGMDLLSRIDPFGGITELKIHTGFQSRNFFQHRNTIFLRTARINRGFIHHIIPFFQGFRHRTRCSQQWSQIRLVMIVYRCRNGNDKKGSLPQVINRRGKFDISIFKRFGIQFFTGIYALAHHRQTLLVDIKTYH